MWVKLRSILSTYVMKKTFLLLSSAWLGTLRKMLHGKDSVYT